MIRCGGRLGSMILVMWFVRLFDMWLCLIRLIVSLFVIYVLIVGELVFLSSIWCVIFVFFSVFSVVLWYG